jgi:hypothetical protein
LAGSYQTISQENIMKNNQHLRKEIIANQLNIDTSRVLDVKKTWKNWVVILATCETGDDLVLLIPHYKLAEIDRLSTAISEFSI